MMQRRIYRSMLALVLTMVLLSCPVEQERGDTESSTADPGGRQIPLGLTVVADGLTRPLFVTAAPGQPGRLYIVEQGGRVRIDDNGTLLETPFMDLSALTGGALGERGLLGLAFHPAYERNGRFYVNYTDLEGATVVALYCRFADDEYRADPATAAVLLRIPQPFSNHNGGMLAFGPDGYLYIASGDGGSGNDPENNGQSLGTLLGKILRVDVDSASPYGIPPDNPFAGVAGAREEIWAYGLRNPWRMSFDRATGDLWIGDVGQNALEEIDFQAADSPGGENYGWRNREGDQCRPGEVECEVPGAVDPIYVYARSGSQSVTGGYVYRGSQIPDLAGVYFFADYVGGTVFSLVVDAEGMATVIDETANLTNSQLELSNIASFGEDLDGELYIVDYGAGVVYKVVPG